MHGAYNYMSVVYICKVSLESIIDKVLLQNGHFVEMIRNYTWPQYSPCFWQKGLSFTQFLFKSCQTRTLHIHIDYDLHTRGTCRVQ